MTDSDATAAMVSVLFDPEPETWGLRGDPYLWRALREHLAGARLPRSADELTRVLHAAFRELTEIDIATDSASMAYQQQYAHGGMSSGMISLDTWRETLFPLLAGRWAGEGWGPTSASTRRT